MTKFKQTSNQGSKSYYNFDTLGFRGSFSIDKNSQEIKIEKVSGIKYNENSIEELLHLAKKCIAENNFPKTYTYAIG